MKTWVCLPTCSKANLLTLGSSDGKCSIYCRAPSKESRWLVLKRLKFLKDCQGKVFKDRVKDRVGWWSSHGNITGGWWFWLVGGEVIGKLVKSASSNIIITSKWSGIYMLVCVCSVVQLWLFVAHQAPLPMEFSRQEYWSGLPLPTPGILPTQGLN